MSLVEDATHFLIDGMRNRIDAFGSYGYHVYLPRAMESFADQKLGREQGLDREGKRYQMVTEMSPAFFAAAWDLCRRGIIRPGVFQIRAQATDDGSAGAGFSVTPFGEQWLAEHDRDDYVPTEPGRFAEMLQQYATNLGPEFRERAQEAIRCYGAHAYLACCAMCGAAAESIVLALRIAQTDDLAGVLATYNSQGGRGRVEKALLGKGSDALRREFSAFSALLKYWRDEASHGAAASISDNEAYTSLALLLRLAMFVHSRWDELIAAGA